MGELFRHRGSKRTDTRWLATAVHRIYNNALRNAGAPQELRTTSEAERAGVQRQAEAAAAEAERLRGELREAQARAEAADREMQAAMAVVQVRRSC